MKNPFEQCPVIEFEDIRKGDTIGFVTQQDEGEFHNAQFGVADNLQDGSSRICSWRTKNNWGVAWDDKNAVIYLIDRPKPELPTEKGSLIFVKKYDGVVLTKPALALLDSCGDWYTPDYIKYSSIGLKEWTVNEKDKAKIEEWTLAEAKEVTA